MGFKKVQLNQYFDNSEAVIKKYSFTSTQIFNRIESGIQTVPNVYIKKPVALTGKREVA